MDNLTGLKHQLKEDLPKEGISHVLKALKAELPDNSPKYNAVIQIDSDYRDIKMQLIEGTLSDEDLRLFKNDIRKRLLELIDSLEEDDFDQDAQRSKLEPDENIQHGHVLYQIPKTMELGQESNCRVRIAFEKAMLIEDIDIDEDTAFRDDVRLSDFMKVEIIDPSADHAFEIRTTTEPIQLIDADDFTEWKFYVKPVKPGKHTLELKVCIMLVVDGREVVREKTLEENIVIITEAVPATEEEFTRLPETYAVAPTSSAASTATTTKSVVKKSVAAAAGKTKVSKRSVVMGMNKAMAASVGLVLMIGAALTFGLTPKDRLDWWKTHYLSGDEAAYESYLAEHIESEYADDAIFYKAKLKKSPDELDSYLLDYPNGKHAEEAARKIDELAETGPESIASDDPNQPAEDEIKDPTSNVKTPDDAGQMELVNEGKQPDSGKEEQQTPDAETPSTSPDVTPQNIPKQNGPKSTSQPSKPEGSQPADKITPLNKKEVKPEEPIKSTVPPAKPGTKPEEQPAVPDPILEVEIAGNIVFSGHNGPINSVAFSPDGTRVLTGGNDKTAKLWDLKGKEIHSFEGHSGKVRSVAFSPDGKSILTGSDDRTAKLWNIKGEELKTFTGHDDKVLAVAFSPDGQKILTGSIDNTAKLWNLDGEELQSFVGHSSWVRAVTFSPDGRSILTGSYDNSAKRWNLAGRQIQSFKGHQHNITAVAFSPNGKNILTGSYDKSAKLWNLEGQEIHTFKGHNDWVMAVAFSPDGKSILTGSYDRTAKLWSLQGLQFESPEGHTDKVISVAYSPSGKMLLTSQVNGKAKLWRVVK